MAIGSKQEITIRLPRSVLAFRYFKLSANLLMTEHATKYDFFVFVGDGGEGIVVVAVLVFAVVVIDVSMTFLYLLLVTCYL